MALTTIEVASVSSTSTARAEDKQIAVTSSSSNTILYTVPAGRKAELYFGHQYTYANGHDYYLIIDVGGVQIHAQGGLTAQSANYKTLTTPLMTLLAGTIVKTRSSNNGAAYIFGVETNA